MAKRPSASSSLRLIGGQWRRRILPFPEIAGLRPTPDRVRETLFNWLGQDLSGQHCLDLFAGSGALGLEAASRHAARVVLVETQSAAVAGLRANIERLGAGATVEVERRDALEFCALANDRFNVVFLDPPYRQGWLERLAGVLPRVLADDAVIYAEAEWPLTSLGPELSAWQVVRAGRAGQVCYQLFKRQDDDECQTAE